MCCCCCCCWIKWIPILIQFFSFADVTFAFSYRNEFVPCWKVFSKLIHSYRSVRNNLYCANKLFTNSITIFVQTNLIIYNHFNNSFRPFQTMSVRLFWFQIWLCFLPLIWFSGLCTYFVIPCINLALRLIAFKSHHTNVLLFHISIYCTVRAHSVWFIWFFCTYSTYGKVKHFLESLKDFRCYWWFSRVLCLSLSLHTYKHLCTNQ